MASNVIGLIAALPWATILEKAPGIVDRASGLLDSVRGTSRTVPMAPVVTTDAAERERQFGARIAALDAAVITLDRQMDDAGALIANLAESNRTLVATVDKLRLWLGLLAVVSVVALGLAAVALLR